MSDMTGFRVGRITVTEMVPGQAELVAGARKWYATCECGATVSRTEKEFKRSKTNGCKAACKACLKRARPRFGRRRVFA